MLRVLAAHALLSAIEWAYYVQAPPFGAEPFSDKAYDWAASYGLHHWGFVAWALYSLPTLAISYLFEQGAMRCNSNTVTLCSTG